MISPFYLKHKSTMNIYIFKTNIETKKEADNIKKMLSSALGIKQFSIDLEDVDKVLRIEAHKILDESKIINEVISGGFSCEELE
ncbi:methyltransferase type 11 [uncultured Psychroserpens sp.]|uniref:methyltransferase type 11 n=1 Tax=uncultured Psychroserpens sp. TaxID=255436 RepID=UPI002612CAC2|nr:methyltransferase type 11 [uncultured Psychroserpens sp.]